MTILIAIDGLMSAAPEQEPLPVLERLAARGRTGRLQFRTEPWFEWLGGFSSEWSTEGRDLPLGYASSLALAAREEMAWPDPTRIWCCLGFTHLYKKQNDLIFLSAERTGQSPEECRSLVEALLPDMQEAGWSWYAPVRAGEDRVAVFSRAATLQPAADLQTQPLERLEGRSFRACAPTGPYAATLLRLLTVGQLILARHPLNRQRQRGGRVTLNTPWMWGVGSGMGFAPHGRTGRGCCWTAEPVLAGLAHARGFRLAGLNEQEDFTPLVTALQQVRPEALNLIHLSLPSVLARHGLLEERRTFLQRVNDQLLEPLTRMLANTQESLLITSLYPPGGDDRADARPAWPAVPWVMGKGRALVCGRRFWHRGRLGEGDVLDVARFWSLCGV
ncbi:MAG: hypothetical protein H7837_02350 [Magnetococcus sp. MYC-9]